MTGAGASGALLAFGVTALTMTLGMFVVTTVLWTTQERIVDDLRASLVQVKVWGSWVLIAVGLWLIALAIWADWFARFFAV